MAKGGHDVPHDKIHSRYKRSLDNLFDATVMSDRAYFFDNSGDRYAYIARYDGQEGELRIMQDRVPAWFFDALVAKAKR